MGWSAISSPVGEAPNWFGSDGAKIGRGKRLKSDKTPRQLLTTSSEEEVEVDVFGADHEYDEAPTEEQLEENDENV